MKFTSETAAVAGKRSSRKGVPNNLETKVLRENISAFLADDWENAIESYKELSPKEQWDVRCKLLEYCVPKLNRSEISVKDGNFQPIVLNLD